MKFFLDKDKNTVHWEDCSRYKNKANGIFLGWFRDQDQEALWEGKKIVSKARACKYCMDEVRNSAPPGIREVKPFSHSIDKKTAPARPRREVTGWPE